MKTTLFLMTLILASCVSTLSPDYVRIKEGYRLILEENEVTICKDELRHVRIIIKRTRGFVGVPINFKLPSTLPGGLSLDITPNPVIGDTLLVTVKANSALFNGTHSSIISTRNISTYPSKGVILRINAE